MTRCASLSPVPLKRFATRTAIDATTVYEKAAVTEKKPATKKKAAPRKKSAAKKAAEASAKPARKGLAAYFDEAHFSLDLKATQKAETFEEMVNLLIPTLGEHNRTTLLSMLHTREMLGTTGIGRGVAVPHGRTLLTRKHRVAFGRSTKGINYGARDDEPVHLVFLVIAPFQDRNNEYLPTLGKLIEFVRDAANRERLMAVQSFDEFVEAISAAG